MEKRKEGNSSVIARITRALPFRALVILAIVLIVVLLYLGQRIARRPLLNADEQEWLRQKGKLIVAGDQAFPPFEFIEAGEYKGYNVDLMRSLSLVLGVEMELRPMEWSAARNALEQGEVDAIQGMRYTEERDRIYDFTTPFLQSYSDIFVSTEARERIRTLDDLKGLTIAMQEGDVAHDILKKRGDLKFVLFHSQPEALQALAKGRVDAFVGNYFVGNYYRRRLGLENEISPVGQKLFPSPYCMAVQEGDIVLKGILDKGLSDLKSRGIPQMLYSKWFEEAPPPQPPELRPYHYLYFSATLLMFLLVTAMSLWRWNVTLRREVAKRSSAERELRKRFKVLHELGQKLPLLKKEEDLANQVIEIARQVVGLNDGAVWLKDDETGELICVASLRQTPQQRIKADAPDYFVSEAFRSGEPLYVPDITASRYKPPLPQGRSCFAVPLYAAGRAVGVFCGGKAAPDAFGPGDRELILALAGQASIALENLRLRQGLEKQLNELAYEVTSRTLVQEIASLAASSLDVYKILSVAAAKMTEVFEVDHCGMVLFDTEVMQGEVVAEYPLKGALGARIDLREYPAAMYLIENRKPLNVPDTEAEPLLDPIRTSLRSLNVKSMLLVPMIAQEAVLGSIGLDVVGKKREFTTPEIELALTIANQIAVAIQNARLYEDLQRRYHQMAALQDAVKAINSELELKHMLDLLIGVCIGLLDADRSAICLFEDKSARLRCIASENLSSPFIEVLERHSIWPPDVKEPPPPLVVSDVLKEPVLADIRGRLVDEGISSLMYLPLYHRRRLMGVLAVFYNEPHSFSPGEVALAQTLADQAAVAIGNALLFQEVKKAGEEWEATFNAIQDGVVIVDSKHHIRRANEAFARMVGASLKEIVGRKCHEVLHKLHGLHALCPAVQVFESAEPKTIEIEEQSLGLVLRITHYPILDASGKPVGMVIVHRDITEERRLQEHLFQTEKLASLGRMAAGLAHELNNPLTSVLGYAAVLQKEELPEETKQILREIENQARRASNIVRAVLDFAEQRPPYRYKVNLNELIEGILSFNVHRLEGQGIKVVKDLDPDLPETMGDPYQLEQVLVNLVNNAAQALEETSGEKVLQIRTYTRPAEDTREAQKWIVVEVADTGPGIPEEHLSHIFEPFFTTRPEREGMGLALAYSIVTRHEGRIRAENRPEGGARFIVELPVTTGRVTWAESILQRAGLEPSPRKEISVLVISPLKKGADFLRENLKSWGYECYVATSVQDAEKLSRSKKPDVVIYRVERTEDSLNPLEILNRIGSGLDRVIFLVGENVPASFLQNIVRGNLLYLKEPLDLELLYDTIRNLTSQTEG